MAKFLNDFGASDRNIYSSQDNSRGQNIGYFTRNNNINDNLKLSPAALIYLFPEFFSKKPRFGGFKSPCNNIKVKHDELFYSMFIGTLASMEKNRLIKFYRYKKGFLLKSSKIGIIKTNAFDPMEYGYLARRISQLRIGETISIYGVLKVNVETMAPIKYFIGQVFRYDLVGKGLFYNDNPNQPICDRIYPFHSRIPDLSKLIQSFMFYRQEEYKMIKKEIQHVFNDMKPEEEDDWD